MAQSGHPGQGLGQELTEVNGKGSPLDGGGVEVAVLDVQVPGAHRLRPETIEQGNFGSAGYANCKN